MRSRGSRRVPTRPHGAHGTTPAEAFAKRRYVTPKERSAFKRTRQSQITHALKTHEATFANMPTCVEHATIVRRATQLSPNTPPDSIIPTQTYEPRRPAAPSMMRRLRQPCEGELFWADHVLGRGGLRDAVFPAARSLLGCAARPGALSPSTCAGSSGYALIQSFTTVLGILAVLTLAFANGANDNVKPVSTPVGAGLVRARRALGWEAGYACFAFAVGKGADFSAKGVVGAEAAGNTGFLVKRAPCWPETRRGPSESLGRFAAVVCAGGHLVC